MENLSLDYFKLGFRRLIALSLFFELIAFFFRFFAFFWHFFGRYLSFFELKEKVCIDRALLSDIALGEVCRALQKLFNICVIKIGL